jgi:PGF-CTERM protein
MATRRKFLIGAAAATTGLAAAAGSASAQAQTFELELTDGGFVGRSPSSISGTTNPTLEVEAGNRYNVEYTVSYIPELQGLPGRHNMVLRTEDGTLRRTNYVFETGSSQSVSFEASSSLTTWGCEEHSYVSEGEIQASWSDYPVEGGQFDVSGGDMGDGGDGGDMTDTATDTPMGDGGDGGDGGNGGDGGDGGDGGEETSGNGPGFGVGAALTAIGAGAYGVLRRGDGDE